jgi:hypothetical protein
MCTLGVFWLATVMSIVERPAAAWYDSWHLSAGNPWCTSRSKLKSMYGCLAVANAGERPRRGLGY